MPTVTENANRYRRPGPGLLLAAAYPFLKGLAWLLARRALSGRTEKGLIVYQSYQVGDFYMALPAIRTLARHIPVTVIGRPDCLFTLEGLGVRAVGYGNPFFVRPSPSAFLAGFRNAWALRRQVPAGVPVLDLEADPRTAFFLKVAGLSPLIAYSRRYAWLFDRLLPLPPSARHQGAKNEALADACLRALGASADQTAAPHSAAGSHPGAGAAGAMPAPGPGTAPPSADGGLLLSCWTRKDTKNWPFASWDALITFLLAQGRPLRVVVPPDGDEGFRAFRERWRDRVDFLAGGLPEVHAAVGRSAGIVATDNFLGHMGAWLGKPVLWINGSSDPLHVAPRSAGLRVVQVEPMPCRPCGHRCVNPIYKQCLLELKPEAVIAAAEAWLPSLG